MELARANAAYALEQAEKRGAKDIGHGMEAVAQVQKVLDLATLPRLIECFDISNFQGEEAVASRVTFMDDAPGQESLSPLQDSNRHGPKRFRHDERSTRSSIVRFRAGARFDRRGRRQGQLAQAVAILKEFGGGGPRCGTRKARTERDFQASEVASTSERVFIPGRTNPVPLAPHTSAYRLLAHVRDEAHRFAIQYHRLRRDRARAGKPGA